MGSIVATKTINIHYSADFGSCEKKEIRISLNLIVVGEQKADGKSFIVYWVIEMKKSWPQP